jgi:rhamnopyranosyl-N-acetylglucosaminyl-diphospho-decaprenol beta-1,3/1,4-galactofuranosyltransferase
MKSEISVGSVTVAYNAVHILPPQIDVLLTQTRSIQEIVVVDNASTDGTCEMLAERYPQVTVLRLETNVGAAGGFAAGLNYAALEKKHNWVWLFDGDSVPPHSALETLLLNVDNPEVGMLVPMPIHEATGTIYPPALWRNGFVKADLDVVREPIWFADVAVASGSLVRSEAVERIGIPRADFFMDISDLEYCLRMRSRGYKIAVVTRCKMNHQIGDTKAIRILGFRYAWHEHAPWREYYISRNLVYLARSLYPSLNTKWHMTRHLLRHVMVIALFGNKKVESIKMVLQGIVDGWRGKLGYRSLPR